MKALRKGAAIRSLHGAPILRPNIEIVSCHYSIKYDAGFVAIYQIANNE